jgi:hypothetical protein
MDSMSLTLDMTSLDIGDSRLSRLSSLREGIPPKLDDCGETKAVSGTLGMKVAAGRRGINGNCSGG